MKELLCKLSSVADINQDLKTRKSMQECKP